MNSEDSAALPSVYSPSEVLGPIFQAINIEKVVSVVAAVLFIFWLIYTIVAAYHLIRYGHRSAVSIPAICIHVAVSIALALYAVSGLH